MVNENRGVPAVKNLSLDVRAGEIVGIAGIDGNGQSELIQAITGLRKVKSGSIKIKGKDVVGLVHVKSQKWRWGTVPGRPSPGWFGPWYDDLWKHGSSNLLQRTS